MTALVLDSWLEARLKEERRQSGADRYDDVWEGVYTMAPMPTNEHQQIVTDFLVEITSPDDRTREKLPFYSRIGVAELVQKVGSLSAREPRPSADR